MRFEVVFCLLLAMAAPLHGQTRPAVEAKDPEAVAARALAALKENRIADFAGEMHPEALKQFKSSLVSVVDAAEKKGRLNEALTLFKNAKSTDEVRQLDDVAFFTAFYEGMMQIQPRLRDALRGMTLDVIGHVREGADVIHVVYRGTIIQGNNPVSKMSVLSLKANGNGWGMLLSGDIEATAASLKRQFDAGE